jgi:transcriptional regulator with XRE-family HTH domain
MAEAFSRLKFLLDERGLTRAELLRRIGARDRRVNPKTIYRLADPDLPLERIDLHVAGAICEELGVGLSDLIAFSDVSLPLIRRISDEQQQRLDDLMDHHNEGELSPAELKELRRLVNEVSALSLENARRVAAHRRQIRGGAVADRAAS